MKLSCYADESGTDDPTGAMKGAGQGFVGGIIAPASEWPQFSRAWQSVLIKHKAEYFHFAEWRAASEVARGKRHPTQDDVESTFNGWTEESLRSLLLDLATIAGGKLSVGGFVRTKEFHLAKAAGELPAQADPYEHGLEQFFAEVLSSIHALRAPWKRAQIDFIFDQSDKPEWKRVVNDCFARYKAKYPTFATVRLKDKRLELPLQAADMVAYRSRRMTTHRADNNVEGDGFQDSVEFTNALFSSVFTHFHQNKTTMFEAYIDGTVGYEYFRKHG
jgi:hypothetical protein